MFEDYSFVFDIDGTLCPIKKKDEKYEDLVPYADVVDKIRKCKEDGAKIVLFTSRNMASFDSNLGIINKITAPLMIDWLKKWNIPFDEIYFGKPWPGKIGFYVDDRSIRVDEFLNNDLDVMNEICNLSRKR